MTESDLQAGIAIAATRAWAVAEGEGRVQTGKGGDRRSKPQKGIGLIAKPREHFGRMFGVGKNQVEQARAASSGGHVIRPPENEFQPSKGGAVQ